MTTRQHGEENLMFERNRASLDSGEPVTVELTTELVLPADDARRLDALSDEELVEVNLMASRLVREFYQGFIFALRKRSP